MNYMNLPIEICDLRFSLEEIGALAVLMAIPTLDSKIQGLWAHNTHFNYQKNRLFNRGIISMPKPGELEIDIDKVYIEDDFWMPDGSDEFGNTIYIHPDNTGDEFGPYHWILRARLIDNYHVWCVTHSEYGGQYNEIFDTLYETEHYVRQIMEDRIL